MKIELTDDDSQLQPDGKPTLVVLLIDGVKRVPYPATKTIQQLYEDVAKMPTVKPQIPEGPIYRQEKILSDEEYKQLVPGRVQVGIAREDIVRCIALTKDIDGNSNPDLILGHEYRVVGINKVNGVIAYYEVMNEVKNDRIRIGVLPSEIELVKKFVPPPPRMTNAEIKKLHKDKTDQELVDLAEKISSHDRTRTDI